MLAICITFIIIFSLNLVFPKKDVYPCTCCKQNFTTLASVATVFVNVASLVSALSQTVSHSEVVASTHSTTGQ